MKPGLIIFSSLALALVGVMTMAFLAEEFLGKDLGMIVTIIPAALLGANARKITEKFYGKTLLEAYREEE